MGLFFKLSEIAVVGGSFSNIGGHNPIETNDFNCSVVFGPHMQNFKNVKKKILEYKAGFEVKDSNQLTKRLYENLNNRSLNNKSIRNFRELCRVEYKKSKLILKSLIK